MDDQLIKKLFFDRSENAIPALVEKYGDICRKIASNILKDERDVDECLNDAYMAAWKQIPVDAPRRLDAYLYGIVRHLALKKHRDNTAKKRNTYYDRNMEDLAEQLSSGDLVHDQWKEKEFRKCLNTFLLRQKQIDRDIFIRKYWYAASDAEIAEITHKSENYIRVHAHRTKKRLQKCLEEEGYI